MTKFDGHPFFHRVLTIGLVSLLGGGLGVLGVTSVYHLNEKNSKNLPKQPINNKETVSSPSEPPNTEDEFNGQSTIESQVSENITSSNEINQNQLTNTQLSTTRPQRNSVTITLKNGKTYTVSRDNVLCKIDKSELRYTKIGYEFSPYYTILCSSSGVVEDLTGKKEHVYLNFNESEFIHNECFVSKRIVRGSSGLWYHDVKRYESTKCIVSSEFNLIEPLIREGDKWLKPVQDRWLTMKDPDHRQ